MDVNKRILWVFPLVCSWAVLFPFAAHARFLPHTPPAPLPEGQKLLDESNKAEDSSKPEERLQRYQAIIARAHTLGDKDGEAYALIKVGDLYEAMKQPEQAVKAFQEGVRLFHAAADTAQEPYALLSVAHVYNDTGATSKALDLYQQALPLFRAIRDKHGEAVTLNDIGYVYSDLEPSKSLEYYQQALLLFQDIKDQPNLTATLTNMGDVYFAMGQPQKALESYQQAQSIVQTLHDLLAEAGILVQMGKFYSNTGQPQQALKVLNQALPALRAAQDQSMEAYALVQIGNIYSESGEFQQALTYFEQALVLRRLTHNTGGEAFALHAIASVYARTGQHQKSLAFEEQALALHRAAGNKRGEALELSNIGSIYADLRQTQQALDYFQQALPMQRSMHNLNGEAFILYRLGTIYFNLGQMPQALHYYEQALSLYRNIRNRRWESITLGEMGSAYANIKQPEKALELYRQALAIDRSMKNEIDEAITLGYIADMQETQEQLLSAEANMRQALHLYERVRANISGLTDSKVSFLAKALSTYHLYIHLLLKTSKPTEAFAWTQKAKARALLDLVNNGRGDVAARLTPEEKQKQHELSQHSAEIYAAVIAQFQQAKPDPAKLALLKQQQQQAESALQTFTDSLYSKYPGSKDRAAAATATLQDVPLLLSSDTALLEYVSLNAAPVDRAVPLEQTVLLCVTLEAGKPVCRAYPLAKSNGVLAARANAFRDECAVSEGEYAQKGQDLYALLLQPAQQQLAGKKRLIVCPDGPLWNVPFQALLTPAHKFLAEQYEIDYAYSATTALVARRIKHNPARPHATATMLVCANPDFGGADRFQEKGETVALSAEGEVKQAPKEAETRRSLQDKRRRVFTRGRGIEALPGTQEEARAIQRLFPNATLLTGKEAQEATIKTIAGNYKYLHFATHGLINTDAPMLSSLVLAQPRANTEATGFLTARDIFAMNLSADLVVLSACETAQGQKQIGEGVIGLTWALFAAGAPTSIVSQWSVDDQSTARFMQVFYAGLATKKLHKGQALRQAMLTLMHDKAYRHPCYWAPFILMGDWQ